MRITAEERLLLILLAVTVGGALLFVSAGAAVEAGHVPWKPGSALHFVTRLLNFDAAYATPKGNGVKRLAQGLGAAAVLALAAVMWYRRHSPRSVLVPDVLDNEPTNAPPTPTARWHEAITPAEGAQMALLGLAGWSFLAALWSPWPGASVAESGVLAIGAVWAVCLGRNFSRRAATVGAIVLIALLAVTAALGIWYYHVRNPHQRLKFPVGNPLFLAACLLPGILLAAHLTIGLLRSAMRTGHRWTYAGAAAVAACLVPLLWATRLTGSRGAIVGLAAGVWVPLFVGAKRRLRWLVILLAGIAVFAGYRYVQRTVNEIEGGRGASLRARLYDWRYAWQLFLTRPAHGWGQGGYYLRADSIARPDAEEDPAAFASLRVTHAHNEWLELLADLGAFGIALAALGYGLTLWASGHAIASARGSIQAWCLLGLVASMVALMVEEATDVALRDPGLPAVWYTVLGLTWALMRRDDGPAARARPFPGVVRQGGLIAAGIATITIAAWSHGDFSAALAQARAQALLDEHDWTNAVQDADAAARRRLGAEEYVEARYFRVQARLTVAQAHLDLLSTSLQQPPSKDETVEAARRALHERDLETVRQQIVAAQPDVAVLLNGAPGYPNVAGALGRTLLRWLSAEQRLGHAPKEAAARGLQDQARALVRQEFLRDRLNLNAAVECLAVWPDAPIAERLDWLRIPLRAGPVPGEYRSVVAAVMQEEGFPAAFSALMDAAHAASDAPGPSQWPDRYAPETYRVAAFATDVQAHSILASPDIKTLDDFAAAYEHARRLWQQSADLAGGAARMYGGIRIAHPTLVSVALTERAEFLFQADPDAPQRAVDACDEAVDQVPPIGDRDARVRAIQRQRVRYLIAGAEESTALPLLAELAGPGEAAARQLGIGYVALCREYLTFPPALRPASFAVWVDRAAALAPDRLDLLRADTAYAAGEDEMAVQALREAEAAGAHPAEIEDWLARALAGRPDSKVLQDFAAAHRAAGRTTQPVPPDEAGGGGLIEPEPSMLPPDEAPASRPSRPLPGRD